MIEPEGRRIFRREKPHSNPYRMMIWLGLIMIGIMVYRAHQQGVIPDLFGPTPTPTRTILSYEQQGDTYFQLGKLDCEAGKSDCAIGAYEQAAQLNPNSVELWTKLARIQTYSSVLLSTDAENLQRLKDAQASIEKAVALAPDDSSVHAIKAFVLDWYSSNTLLTKDEVSNALSQAQSEATTALQLDAQNTEALAFGAEIMVDQQQWQRAQSTIQQALERDPNSMDVHRINAYILESVAQYTDALTEYQKASALAPNLTFLYIEIGKLYRQLALKNTDATQSADLYTKALDAFAEATQRNAQLGIHDPTPYIAIANTYAQTGDFFAAVLNARKALNLNPTTATVYAQLGLVYHKSRNYEGAIQAFQCALAGCTPAESCVVRQDCNSNPTLSIEIKPIALTDNTLVYYYTYGSVLAALSKPINDYCDRAATVFGKVTAKYSSDTSVMSIVESGESICAAPSPTTAATIITSGTPGAKGTGTAPAPTQKPSVTPMPTATPSKESTAY
jgi:tetratricopeptide (TPR) repeat protein